MLVSSLRIATGGRRDSKAHPVRVSIVTTGEKPTINEERKPKAVLLIAAPLIAAVRLNREEIKSSPIVHSKIAHSIPLAEMIQARLRGREETNSPPSLSRAWTRHAKNPQIFSYCVLAFQEIGRIMRRVET